MKVELIFVGSELVSGKTLNTNASYISKKLKELGATITDSTRLTLEEVFIEETEAENENEKIREDISAVKSRDPAAKSAIEIFLLYDLHLS